MLPDPLQYGFALPLAHTFFPMGFPVRITTNSEDVIQAAGEAWGCCEKLFGHHTFGASVRYRWRC